MTLPFALRQSWLSLCQFPRGGLPSIAPFEILAGPLFHQNAVSAQTSSPSPSTGTPFCICPFRDHCLRCPFTWRRCVSKKVSFFAEGLSLVKLLGPRAGPLLDTTQPLFCAAVASLLLGSWRWILSSSENHGIYAQPIATWVSSFDLPRFLSWTESLFGLEPLTKGVLNFFSMDSPGFFNFWPLPPVFSFANPDQAARAGDFFSWDPRLCGLMPPSCGSCRVFGSERPEEA